MTLLGFLINENALQFLSAGVPYHFQIKIGTGDRCVHEEQSDPRQYGFLYAVLFQDRSVPDFFKGKKKSENKEFFDVLTALMNGFMTMRTSISR